ncbi:MAG: hypothetical protein U5M51_00950 [Emticicia sp.]|nr:hypothetical protein [Emticicia sp.]
MYNVRLIEGDKEEQIIEYPYLKEKILSRIEFEGFFKLYFIEIFFNSDKNLIDITFEGYKEGYFYFNESSVIMMGCSINDAYWGFTYLPCV